ncbi:MAG: 16S rRNA (cytosine(967)-C(5))-methyltransferase RsmB [Clostridiales bacterium]|nr:16S rRNA (cytosine(967)-C(5))-methyltransferase RsmB [Clostridiales bacterium]
MAGQGKPDAREGAFEILARIEDGAYAGLTLDDWLEGPGKGLSRADKGLLTELVQGVVKRKLTLDWMIDQRVNKLRTLQKGPRILLRLGLYQLYYLDRIPDSAATNETVELAGRRFHRGVASLVNGVLRSWLREKDNLSWPDEERDPVDAIAVRYSHPPWLIERWLARYGADHTKAFCRFNNAPPPRWIRTNTLRISPEGLSEKLASEGCKTEPGRYAPEALVLLDAPEIRKLASFREGFFTVQDESSMLAAHGLQPLPGQRVLDLCAAPGGKCSHLAQLMEDQGRVDAWDIHPRRASLIRETQRRMGIRCIEVSVKDATALLSAEVQESGGYDRILVDAPCSGLGVLRRRADARWRHKPEDIAGLAALQEQILRSALPLLAPGGKLLYSTCTTEPEENRQVLEKTLAGHPAYREGKLALPVIHEENRRLLPDPEADGEMQLLPFIHGLEGFYMAVMERKA